MKKKLTLRLEERVIEKAKRIAKERGTSVSRIVENYFSMLKRTDTPSGGEHRSIPEGHVQTAFTSELIGAFGDEPADYNEREEYYRYLEEKHR